MRVPSASPWTSRGCGRTRYQSEIATIARMVTATMMAGVRDGAGEVVGFGALFSARLAR